MARLHQLAGPNHISDVRIAFGAPLPHAVDQVFLIVRVHVGLPIRSGGSAPDPRDAPRSMAAVGHGKSEAD